MRIFTTPAILAVVFLPALLCALIRADEPVPSPTYKKISKDFASQKNKLKEEHSLHSKSNKEKADADFAKGLWELSLWAGKNNLQDLFRATLEEIITVDPNHEKARKALGYLHFDKSEMPEDLAGTMNEWQTERKAKKIKAGYRIWKSAVWVPKEDLAKLEKGLLQVNGKWKPREEVEKFRDEWKNRWILKDDHWELHTTTSYEKGLQVLEMLEAEYRAFVKFYGDDFVLTGPEKNKLVVNLFEDRKEFVSLTEKAGGNKKTLANEAVMGLYLYAKKQSFFYEVQNQPEKFMEILRHEAMHQLMDCVMGEKENAWLRSNGWLIEAPAVYWENYQPLGGELALGERFVRGYDLPQAMPNVDLRKLLSAKSSEINSPATYAQAGILYHFFMHAEGGQYRKPFFNYVKKAREGKGAPQKLMEKEFGLKLEELEKEWKDYAKTFELD